MTSRTTFLAAMRRIFGTTAAAAAAPAAAAGEVMSPTAVWDTGNKWIDGRSIWAKYVNIGNLPNATEKTVAHGITGTNIVLVRYYGIVNCGGGVFANFPANGY